MTDTITLPREVAERILRNIEIGNTLSAGIEMRREIEAALEQPQVNSPEIPEGWKLVPVKPTEAMLHAGDSAIENWGVDANGSTTYRAMLNAAPQPPVVEQPQSVTDCHQSKPQGEQEPNPRWPSNASEVRAFLSGRVATERYARDDHQPDDNDTYTLSAHDLLEAIDWWTDFDPQPKREPLTDEWIRSLCKYPWLFETVKQWVRIVERAHRIGGEA